MGSRAVVIVCRDEAGGAGAVRRHRRARSASSTPAPGRRFFNDADLEAQFLDRVRAALTAADFWDEFDTNWVCLDCELMPWSAKAQELLQDPVRGRRRRGAGGAAHGRSRRWSRPQSGWAATSRTSSTQVDAAYRRREEDIGQFVAAYRHYCWPVDSLTDLKLAPFHLLATEGQVHTDKDHVWHMETLAEVCRADPELLLATAVQGRGRDRPGQRSGRASPGGRS